MAAINDSIPRGSKRLPKYFRNQFSDFVLDFKDIFRTRIGADPPVDVPPMEIEFDGAEHPVKVIRRTYSP